MPILIAQPVSLKEFGPLVEAQLFPSAAALEAMANAGQPVPQPLAVTALIDTGTSGSVIQQGIAQRLGLSPFSTQAILNTPSSAGIPSDLYQLELVFPPTAGIQLPIRFESVFVEAPLEGEEVQCLLGRDFLSYGILVYTGPSNSFSFSV